MGLSASNTYVKNTINSLSSVVNKTVATTTQNIQTACTGFNTFNAVIGSIPTMISSNGDITLTPCQPPPTVPGLDISQVSNNSCGIQGGITQTLTQNMN